MFDTIRAAVVGCGRWGINHVRTAHTLLGPNLAFVFDTDPSAEKRVKQIAESIPFTNDVTKILDDQTINAVVIATPAATHFDLTKKFLEKKKHVLVEKPITLVVSEAKELDRIARNNGATLMVGHVLLYHPAIVALKNLYGKGKIGSLQYIYSNRLNLGAIRSEENILWSFAPHDLSIIQDLTGTQPLSVFSHGAKFVQSGIEDVTITYLRYPNNVHAHIFVSWLHPFKEQRLVVVGDKGMFVFEDSAVKDKLKFFPKGFRATESGVEKFDGEFESVAFAELQPLTEEHKHFYDCIENHREPLTNGKHAIEVLEILSEASKNLNYV